MRLDIFLKLSRLVPRRTLAQQLCEAGNVTVNDLAAFTGQLVRSDRYIVRLLHSVPAAGRQLVGAENDLTPSLNVLLANLTSTFKVTNV